MPIALHLVPMPGTRATTLLLAFDAGARTERAEENGMAHFLEHLVFKGGEKFPDHRAVNETAERMGGVLNAYTSHDLVAFHITVRAEAADEALDLLTDFVGRPRLDAGELDRERGVVIQEINRAKDQPSVVAEHLIDVAAFGEHPLGRTVLGPEEHLRTFSRDAIVAFRERRWARGAAFAASATSSTSTRARRPSCSSGSLRRAPPACPSPTSPRRPCARSARWRRATPTSRTCACSTAPSSTRPTPPPARR